MWEEWSIVGEIKSTSICNERHSLSLLKMAKEIMNWNMRSWTSFIKCNGEVKKKRKINHFCKSASWLKLWRCETRYAHGRTEIEREREKDIVWSEKWKGKTIALHHSISVVSTLRPSAKSKWASMRLFNASLQRHQKKKNGRLNLTLATHIIFETRKIQTNYSLSCHHGHVWFMGSFSSFFS